MSATDELGPWWERWPERLRWELANFADQGLSVSHELGPGGPHIRTAVELSDGRRIEVGLSFPYEYPNRPPSVRVQSGLLGPPHEAGGRLCLFDDPERTWHPQRSAANLVTGRVQALLQGLLVDGRLPDELEEQIPDQTSRLFFSDSNRVVFVPDPYWGTVPDWGTGAAILQGDSKRQMLVLAEGFGLASTELVDRLGVAEGQVTLGRWVALTASPTESHTGADLLEVARAELPELLEPVGYASIEPRPPAWVAINFPEEGPRKGQWRRSWAFVSLSDSLGNHSLWTTQALTLAERHLRTPELVGFERAKVVLIGAGSLGSKVALELAKAGCGHLTIFDTDTYDVNNAPRHELAPRHAGEWKAEAMADLLRAANPFVAVKPDLLKIGSDVDAGSEFLASLNGTALVVETTGARATTRIASRYCRATGVPLLCASLTRGSRGGDMVLLDPVHCLDCFLLAQDVGEIPKPQEGEQRALVIPVGCADPAFSGPGFDSSELASAVARMAIRITGLTSYPPLDHNWAVVNFVAEPHWQQGTLDPDPRCGHLR
jgi:molybdopterin/thiamine biosynthesis adenylyltransferase